MSSDTVRAAPKRKAAAELTLAYTPDERSRNQWVEPLQAQLREEAAAARARADAQPDQKRRRGGHDPQAEAVVQQAGQTLQQASLRPAANGAAAAPRHEGGELPADTVRITYLLQPGAQGQAMALVLRGPHLRRVVLGAGSADISRAVAQLRRELNSAEAGVPAAARQLHQWLIAPLKPWLDRARHLQVLPDGALRYLPFAALHDGRQYLVQRHSLSTRLVAGAAPAATARAAPGARPAVAAFGRSLPSAQHGALPGVHQELAAIEALTLARVSVARDAQFTRESLTRTLQAAPQMVHLASHFVLAPATEEDSYLLLGDGERMPLRELRQLPWQGVRLALLSACDSAVPLDHDSATQGREWAGLAAALQQAGVPDVMTVTAALACSLVPRPASAETFALLVGVAQVPAVPKRLWLRGPDNEVALMRAPLLRLGVPAAHITGLSGLRGDERPTLRTIEAAMQATLQRLQPGDLVVLHLAGHGVQVPQRPGKSHEPDGLDEVFLTADTQAWDAGRGVLPQSLYDQDIGAWSDAVLARGARLLAVFDTCHAAGLHRSGAGRAGPTQRPASAGFGRSPAPAGHRPPGAGAGRARP